MYAVAGSKLHSGKPGAKMVVRDGFYLANMSGNTPTWTPDEAEAWVLNDAQAGFLAFVLGGTVET